MLQEIPNGFTVSQIIPASKSTPKESAVEPDTAVGASVQTGSEDLIHTQTDIHDLYPAVSGDDQPYCRLVDHMVALCSGGLGN